MKHNSYIVPHRAVHSRSQMKPRKQATTVLVHFSSLAPTPLAVVVQKSDPWFPQIESKLALNTPSTTCQQRADASEVTWSCSWSLCNGRTKFPTQDQSSTADLWCGKFEATTFLSCHLTLEYMMHSLEVKWNGWWGTGFLKHKKQHMNNDKMATL
jgi:hypothetical protein